MCLYETFFAYHILIGLEFWKTLIPSLVDAYVIKGIRMHIFLVDWLRSFALIYELISFAFYMYIHLSGQNHKQMLVLTNIYEVLWGFVQG